MRSLISGRGSRHQLLLASNPSPRSAVPCLHPQRAQTTSQAIAQPGSRPGLAVAVQAARCDSESGLRSTSSGSGSGVLCSRPFVSPPPPSSVSMKICPAARPPRCSTRAAGAAAGTADASTSNGSSSSATAPVKTVPLKYVVQAAVGAPGYYACVHAHMCACVHGVLGIELRVCAVAAPSSNAHPPASHLATAFNANPT